MTPTRVHSSIRTRREELANALTHGAGTLAAVAVTAGLVILAANRAGATAIVSVSVFGASLVLLYLASTLYHASRCPTAKARFKILDHSAIYILIAGTYTPFMLVGLRGGWGWSLFGVIWGLAVLGVVFKLFTAGRFRGLSTAIYVAMGWLVLVAAVPTLRALTPATLALLLAGGVSYTAGTFFYHQRRMPYAHAVWHLFVMAGSGLHVVAVGLLVAGH